ncbi:MAG TPA: GDSL family lipase [Clostridia bacterium]|nr:GDSL family lipase [Clostridia bacterium]
MLIVCLGDSITYGYPYGPTSSWVHLAQAAFTGELVNKGQNGDTTGDMLARFDEDVIALAPTDVVVLGGTNDAWYQTPPATVQKNIAAMFALARRHRIRFHLGLPIPINKHAVNDPDLPGTLAAEPYLDSYRAWMQSYAREQNINIIDFYTPMRGKDGAGNPAYFVDACHPNRQGYEIMATTMIGYLQTANLA